MTRRYLLDTGAVEGWLTPGSATEARALRAIIAGAVLGTCTPVLGELWYGIENSQTHGENAKRLARGLPDLTIWPYEVNAAREFGRLRALLRRIGRPMQQIDVQIAAIALSLGRTTVVSKDSDLLVIPGLAVEDWSVEVPAP
jgi:tRNA(fMet)-specific endonuclease VapC